VQIDNFSDGTGIGLPMARNIAQRLGGDIRLDTEYNNGARFILTLPR
jgi:signal transduction histidine kinase